MIERRHYIQLWLIIFAGVVFMAMATPYDQSLSEWLRTHHVLWFDVLMSDSIFEGEILGTGDYTVITMIVCLIGYLLAWNYEKKRRKPCYQLPRSVSWFPAWFSLTPEKLISLRPYLGFILLNAFCVTVLFSHSLKWIMARPRPDVELPFSQWYQVGAHFIAEGSYRGSFPSGHVTTSVALFGVAYCLVHASRGKGAKFASVIFSAIIVIMAVLMSLSRTMNGSHWPTDVVFSFFGGWAITHLLFFWGYRLPERIVERDRGIVSQDVSYIELIFCLLLFLCALGTIALCIGLRGYLIYSELWILLIVVFGGLLSTFSATKAHDFGLFTPMSEN